MQNEAVISNKNLCDLSTKELKLYSVSIVYSTYTCKAADAKLTTQKSKHIDGRKFQPKMHPDRFKLQQALKGAKRLLRRKK